MCTTKAVTPYLDLNITARACHSPNHNVRHKRAADECVNPRSIQRSPENDWKLPNFKQTGSGPQVFLQKNFNLGIYFLIKAIECLVNRLLRYQILGFIFSIFINLDASMLVSPKEVFRNLMCWDMMESSKRRNFTYTFMGRNFKKGGWTGWSYRSSFHRRSWL